MQGKKEYSEKLFLSFQLSQKVPENNFYRRLKNSIDLHFVTQQTNQYYGTEGQQSIDPEVFFKLMLVGYLENINSDRKIIEHAAMRLDILFFIGYDIDEELPWHSTLSRTRKLYGQEVFLSLFRKVLSLCISKGMVSGKRQAIDSAFVKANASMDSLEEKMMISDTQTYLDQLTENDEEKQEPVEKKKKGNRRYSPTDADARLSTKPGKPTQLNYSGQISVDTKNHVICGAMADFADKRDSQSLPAILATTIDNLKTQELTIEEVLADTNYSSGEALKALEFHKIKGYIPSFGLYKYNHEGFTYDENSDSYMCSQGVQLTYRKTYTRLDGTIKKEYRTLRANCKGCPLMSTCLGKSHQKSIQHSIDKPYYDRMHERMQTRKGKRMRKLRQATVEPVLGTLINFLGMKRVNTRGIAQVNKHVLMAAIAYNLKKYMNYAKRNRNNTVIAEKRAFQRHSSSIYFEFILPIYQLLGINKSIFYQIKTAPCFSNLKCKQKDIPLTFFS
jgi:transposase